ncbi:hypothetical protein [Gilvimarinus sp. 2_MG-2023]|uniref:hypothetical protein n=1 Tax=Gilvimarinus sp. 2_MG-2023 TaxID=3062666 RepID=UPI0026E286A4|nr:hypothetical protein [Gilvimarinus sp. 2_MG-2023]
MLIVPSLLTGAICALISRGFISAILAGALPWLGLLAALIYSVYFTPYEGGGASLWLVAQVVGGTVAAACGFAGFSLVKQLRSDKG